MCSTKSCKEKSGFLAIPDHLQVRWWLFQWWWDIYTLPTNYLKLYFLLDSKICSAFTQTNYFTLFFFLNLKDLFHDICRPNNGFKCRVAKTAFAQNVKTTCIHIFKDIISIPTWFFSKYKHFGFRCCMRKTTKKSRFFILYTQTLLKLNLPLNM